MKFSVSTLCFFCLLFAAFEKSQAQTPTISSIQNSIATLADNYPQERIYLQFDKPSYAPGETIWFKAYIMAAADPSAISKTLYVDFITADGRVIKHCINPVLQSGAAGNYDLPLEFKNDYIYVKAYTKWMLNFDSSFLYRKTLHIIQQKTVARKQAVPAVKTNMQFLPEGGYMVNGLECNVAVKAIHYDGTPARVSGAVLNSKSQQVADIKTVHDGMGAFKLSPDAGETYTAKWKDDMGNSYQTKLPAAKSSGVALKVSIQPAARSFVIERSEDAAGNFQKLYIVATMQQHLVYAAGINLSQVQVTGGSIPVSALPSGILQVTLFDSNWVAVAERITFINNNDYSFDPEVGFAELGTEKRKENTLVIRTPDSITSNLSVSVTDEGIGIDSSDDIISRLLLSGDLKGNVYHPFYYFQNNSDTLQKQLDLVMLTNGWRSIAWDDVVHNKFPQIRYQNDTSYLSLSGKVFGTTEQALKKGLFILMIIKGDKDTTNRVQQTVVDASSNFNNPNIILYDTTKVYYRISGTDEFAKSSVVSFDNSLNPNHVIAEDTAANAFFADTATENYKRKLAAEQMRNWKLQQGSTLADVTVTTKAKSPLQVMDEKYASPLFSGQDGYAFNVLDDRTANNSMSVLQYLQGKIPGLSITTSPTVGSTGSASYRGGGSPDFFFNETNIDLNYLSSISMSDVAYIKFLRPPFIGSIGGGANGAIAIYSRRGGDVSTRPTGPGLPYKVIIGYTAQKQFYSPNYGTFDQRNDETDMRSTLYWAPTILTTPSNNTVRLKFYNNDFSHGFRVVLEGMSTDGKLTHIEKVVE
jgi:hypothetical protein